MKPCNKIKKEILLDAANEPDLNFGLPLDTDEQVEEAYQKLRDADAHHEYESEYREGDVKTNIPSEYSRHYETQSVAMKISDGTWVGWTYWYGGGKHGDPGSVEWMEDAYDLDCVEEEKVVVVQTFTKK
jgi:hypothetical protein